MAERDRRYNRSRKGKRRNQRYEATPARRRYMAKWMRAYRRRVKREAVKRG